MKNLLNATILIVLVMIAQGCYYDEPPEPTPFDCSEVSYVTHIEPIMNSSCATSGCHDGSREPNLTSEVAWTNLNSGGFINVINPQESKLYKTVEFIEDPMPPGGPQISELDRELILCWISEGAKNN